MGTSEELPELAASLEVNRTISPLSFPLGRASCLQQGPKWFPEERTIDRQGGKGLSWKVRAWFPWDTACDRM